MIYITGDTHGDRERFRSKEAKKLTQDDVVIVLGDFGFLWDNSKQEQRVLKWLGRRKYRILFLDGKHENYDLLESYPVTEAFGGKVQQINEKVYHLMRGEIYTIEGKKIFVFGGGDSSEKMFRIEQECWWAQELPTGLEMQHALEQLEAAGNRVDLVLTHEAPTVVHGARKKSSNGLSTMTSFFDEIFRRVQYRCWYFGSVHQTRVLSAKMVAVFDRILPADPIEILRKR